MKLHMAIFAYSLGQVTSLIEHGKVKPTLLEHGATESEIEEFKEMAARIADSFHRPGKAGGNLVTEIEGK